MGGTSGGNMVAAGPLDGHVSKGRSEYIVSNNKRKRKGTGLGERTPGNKISDAVKADARSALQLKRLKKETARCEAAVAKDPTVPPMGSYMDGCETTTELCECIFNQGSTCLQMGRTDQGVAALERYKKMDLSDQLGATATLISYWIDEGELGQARCVTESLKEQTTYSSWSFALIQFIAHFVLNEEDASAELVKAAMKQAHQLNPHVTAFLASGEVFEELVPAEEIDELEGWSAGSVEEAMQYCVNELSCWNDAEGSREWIAKWWAHQSTELDQWGDADDEKYLELLMEILGQMNGHPEWLRAGSDDEEEEEEEEEAEAAQEDQESISGNEEEDSDEDEDDECAMRDAEAESVGEMAALHAKLQQDASEQPKAKKPKLSRAEKKKMKKIKQQAGRGRRNFTEKPKKQRNKVGKERSSGKHIQHK